MKLVVHAGLKIQCSERGVSVRLRPALQYFGGFGRQEYLYENINMRTSQERQKVLEYYGDGLNQTEIFKLTNIPRRTIGDWINNPNLIKKKFDDPKQYVLENGIENEYSYILGLYLGDGYINQMPRTWKLRFFLNGKYEELNNFAVNQLKRIFPENVINPYRHPKHDMITIYVHSKKIPLLFPQMGEGMKHTRKIKLMKWQEEIIIPRFFIMGLFHSDGSYYIRNQNDIKYPSYDFRNESDDLHNLFKKYCEILGISCTFSTKPKNTHIYKRDDVNMMLEIIGTKEIINY